MKKLLLALVLFFSTSFTLLGAETANFVVSAPNEALAEKVADVAEKSRKDLAVYWLGRELPAWHKKCPIDVTIKNHTGGGATGMVFDRGQVFGWQMHVEGTPDVILNDVVPHEVNHTIFATHFRRALPRWYDEGAAQSIETDAALLRARQAVDMRQWISAVELLHITEYPRDGRKLGQLYGQAAMSAKMMIEQKGPRAYVRFMETTLRAGYDKALSEYGFKGVRDFDTQARAYTAAYPSAGAAVNPVRRPKLYVFTAPAWCGPCRLFDRDLRSGKLPELRRYDIVKLDIDRPENRAKLDALLKKLKDNDPSWNPKPGVPAFYIEGKTRMTFGYESQPNYLQGVFQFLADDVYNLPVKAIEATVPGLKREPREASQVPLNLGDPAPFESTPVAVPEKTPETVEVPVPDPETKGKLDRLFGIVEALSSKLDTVKGITDKIEGVKGSVDSVKTKLDLVKDVKEGVGEVREAVKESKSDPDKPSNGLLGTIYSIVAAVVAGRRFLKNKGVI